MPADVTATDNDAVDALMQGAIDLACHSGPAITNLKLTHAEAAQEAAAAGMRAIAFINDYYPTTPVAQILDKTVFAELPIKLLSGVVLNNYVGGLNPYAVEHELMLGGQIIWMPTLSAGNHIRQSFRIAPTALQATMRAPVALSVLDAKGKISVAVHEALELIAEHDAVLAAGHLHISEIIPLFSAAREAGVQRLLVTQPIRFSCATHEDLQELAKSGARVELCSAAFDDGLYGGDNDLQALIETVGATRAIFSSGLVGCGLGGAHISGPVEGMRAIIRQCIDQGISEQDIGRMVSANAADLVGLD